MIHYLTGQDKEADSILCSIPDNLLYYSQGDGGFRLGLCGMIQSLAPVIGNPGYKKNRRLECPSICFYHVHLSVGETC